MKVSDLVQHVPSRSKMPVMVKLYEDWGHTPDFEAGLVVGVKDSFALVLPTQTNCKPSWYQQDELEVISEG